MKTIKMHEIIPGRLYQRGEFRKFPLEVRLQELESRNITMIANLYTHPDPDLIRLEPYFYWHYPIPDHKLTQQMKMDLLEYSGIFSRAIRDGGGALLVHCHAGRNRSALFSVLIVMNLLGLSVEQSINHVRKARPNSLANPHFEHWLREQEIG